MCFNAFAHHSEGSNLTPAHHYPDFRFKTYAPLAFRYFRDLFGIKPDDYLVRLPSTSWRSLKKKKKTARDFVTDQKRLKGKVVSRKLKKEKGERSLNCG